jgi:fluoroquinolone transport system permease protein
MMLFACMLAPVLSGLAIRFVIPLTEKMLIRYTGSASVISPYYGLFDIFFSALTPAMFCFVAAMIILEERDDHIDRYLYVTGLGKSGYFISRIMIPSLAAFVFTMILLPVFKLTALSATEIILLSLTGSLQGVIIALMVITISSNKLEGMAVMKLSSLLMLGAMVPYFVPKPQCYFLSFMPSFWTGLAIAEDHVLFMLPAVIISAVWIFILFRHVLKK